METICCTLHSLGRATRNNDCCAEGSARGSDRVADVGVLSSFAGRPKVSALDDAHLMGAYDFKPAMALRDIVELGEVSGANPLAANGFPMAEWVKVECVGAPAAED